VLFRSLLRGRKKPWPKHGTYRTTPDDSRFGGAWFHVEAVYQQTVAELEAKGSVFWLAFVPLAVDADVENVPRIIQRLRNEVDAEEFDELIAAMLSLTRLKKDARHLISVIESASAKEEPMNPFLRLGIERGVEKGIEKGILPLLHQFERRLGRPVTDIERRRIAKRIDKDGADKLGDVVLDLSPAQLDAWLAPRKASKRES